MKNNPQNTNAYFAAANGYNGFRSYFSSIFNPYDYRRIFIIKGGPGTGKSSLMKSVLNSESFRDFNKEAIYCSSDPDSLDGIIIAGQVAIIDGTAPHETDAKIPGVFDEIINLGENWNEAALLKNAKFIKETNIKKAKFYNSAYKYLSFIKNLNDYKMRELKSSFNFKKADELISTLMKDVKKDSEEKSEIRLISSFGRYGLKRLDTPAMISNISYSIKGIYGSEYIFTELIKKSCENASSHIHFPSVFSDEVSDGVFFKDAKLSFTVNADYGEVIDTSDFISFDSLSENEIKDIERTENTLLKKAEEYFRLASEEHFKLEEIYSSAMDFDKNKHITEKIIDKCESILKT